VPKLHRGALGADDYLIEADFAIESARDVIVLAHFERDAATIQLVRLGFNSPEQHRTDARAADL
jgi:hypothetical protein